MKVQLLKEALWFGEGAEVNDEQVSEEDLRKWIKIGLAKELIDKPEAPKPIKEKKPSLDLNKDGKIDGKDASIAGRVLRKIRSKKKIKRGRRK